DLLLGGAALRARERADRCSGSAGGRHLGSPVRAGTRTHAHSGATRRDRTRRPGRSGTACGIRLLASQLEVLLDAAWQVAQVPVEDRELPVGDAFDEVAVVTHDQQGAGPRVEQVL